MTATKKSYYPYFDYLRIVLVSVVMLSHDNLLVWNEGGKLAVDVFFALSGWLIGGLLIRTKIADLPRFYFNRALRIWVPYYIALIFIVIVSLLKDPINFQWFEFIIYKLTWVYNIFGSSQLQTCRECMPLGGTGNHFWSVNAEEQFYLLAPLLLVVFAKYGRKLMTWVLIVASLWFLNIYVPIALGVLAAIINNQYPDFYTKKINQGLLLLIFIGSILGLWYTTDYKLYAALFSISLVLLLAIKGNKSAMGSFLGGISYPLYLNHWIGVFFFNLILEPFGLRDSGTRQLLSVLMNYGVAAFLYWFIERRVLMMKDTLYTRRKGIFFTLMAYFSINSGLIFGLVLNPSFNLSIVLAVFVITTCLIITSVLLESHFSDKKSVDMSV